MEAAMKSKTAAPITVRQTPLRLSRRKNMGTPK